MNCIIIEDQPPAQRILKKYINDVESLQLLATFSDPLQAAEILREGIVELMFLDINLPKISGIDFLKSLNKAPFVIITTAYTDYALEGYELNVLDYLLKPFSFQRFIQAIHKIPHDFQHVDSLKSTTNEATQTELFIKSGHELIKVFMEDIYSISSDSDYTEVRTSGRKVLSNQSLKHWLDLLPSDQFFQVHKSHIIQRRKIDRISGYYIHLLNGQKIPIGRAYKESFLKRILDK